MSTVPASSPSVERPEPWPARRVRLMALRSAETAARRERDREAAAREEAARVPPPPAPEPAPAREPWPARRRRLAPDRRRREVLARARRPPPRVPTGPPPPTPPDVLQALAGLPVAPTVDQVADVMRLPVDVVAGLLAHLERRGMVETWDELGGRRVMLSARALGRLGLELSPRGTHWRPVDSPPEPAADRWLAPPAAARPGP